jgi:hypothetical protein
MASSKGGSRKVSIDSIKEGNSDDDEDDEEEEEQKSVHN